MGYLFIRVEKKIMRDVVLWRSIVFWIVVFFTVFFNLFFWLIDFFCFCSVIDVVFRWNRIRRRKYALFGEV